MYSPHAPNLASDALPSKAPSGWLTLCNPKRQAAIAVGCDMGGSRGKMNNRKTLIGLALGLLLLAPIGCGTDDDGDAYGTGGTSATGGSGGTTSTGGTVSTGGTTSSGGSGGTSATGGSGGSAGAENEGGAAGAAGGGG